MKRKISIRKVMIVAVWLAVASGLLTLLIAASRKERTHTCKEVVVNIRGVGESFYVDKSDISGALKYEVGGKLVGKPVKALNLAKLESSLENNAWIGDAELYFDSQDVLHVTVKEREPIARVFTTAGNSFYIDTAAMRIPVLEGTGIRVPVFTSFIPAKRLNKQDSVLLNDVKLLAQFVISDKFWNAQVAQIDIANGNFELVPTIGNHIIKLGDTENLEDKFRRLTIFYKQVLSKTGFDKYSVIDAQFAGQIVGVHKGANQAIDSIQLKKNIDELMKHGQLNKADQQPMLIDSAHNETLNTNTAKPATDKRIIEKPTLQQESNTRITTNTKPSPISVKPRVEAKPIEKKRDQKKTPKAVMTKRGN